MFCGQEARHAQFTQQTAILAHNTKLTPKVNPLAPLPDRLNLLMYTV